MTYETYCPHDFVSLRRHRTKKISGDWKNIARSFATRAWRSSCCFSTSGPPMPATPRSSFDGVALAGGADLPPDWYGQTPLEGAGLDLVSDMRPKFEREICDEFLERGDNRFWASATVAQFLNVYRGGALIQDIDLQLPDRAPQLEHADGNIHTRQIRPPFQTLSNRRRGRV